MELFPDVIEFYQAQCKANANTPPTPITKPINTPKIETEADIVTSWLQVGGLVGVLGVVLYFMMQLAILD